MLSFRSVSLSVNGTRFLEGFDLDLDGGAKVAIVVEGERATRRIIRAAMGLEPVDGGEVALFGETLAGLTERRRLVLRSRVGMMFHNSGLLYNLTVWYNVALPALYHNRTLTEEEIVERVEQLLRRCGIAHLADQRPSALNEFDRKRAALARAWMLSPSILLLENPLMDIEGPAESRLMDLIFGPSPPDWVDRDPRPEHPSVLMTTQGLHEAVFRYIDRLIVLGPHGVEYDGQPRTFDRRRGGRQSDSVDTGAEQGS